MRIALAVVFLACVPMTAAPQDSSEKDAVIAIVQRFFDAMAGKDRAGLERVLLPDGRYYSVRENQDPAIRTFTNAEFIEQLAAQKQTVRERFWDPEVRVHGAIATVWTPYDFWIDGKFSHCGIDAFDLVKTPEGWKLAGGVYTVQREGCPPSPLGPLKP